MEERLYYQADCRKLNRKAILGVNGIGKNQQDKQARSNLHAAPKPDPAFCREIAQVLSAIKERIDWSQELDGASYAVFDTETTGLKPFQGDEIISIGAVLIDNGVILDEPVFYRLVNPQRPLPAQTKRLTGIDDEMLAGQPTAMPVLLDFLHFIDSRILVAHNASFDLAFINLKIGALIGTRIVNPVIDTAMLASVLLPSLAEYSLERLSRVANLDLVERHNALGDARITARLFLYLLPMLLEQGTTTLSELAQLFDICKPKPRYPLIF